MTKVGIQTIIDCNFGNRLQNYALQEVLNDFGIAVETIDDISETCIIQKMKNIIKRALNIRGYRSLLNLKSKPYSKDRGRVINNWNDEYIVFSQKKISRYHVPKNFCLQYDYFITGSDQVWNPYFRKDSLMLLSYARNQQRISYAASFGVDNVTEEFVEKYKRELTQFKAISVREKNAVGIVERLTGSKAEWVVDPTMLLTIDQWKQVEKKPDWLTSEEYIAIYSLGGLPETVRLFVQKIASEKKWKIYEILKKDNPDLYLLTPFEFIYMIGHAKFMVTDSFHGTVFSILYKTPFMIFDREDVHGTMGARFETLFEIFHLNGRKYYDGCLVDTMLTCDFSLCDDIWEEVRRSSKHFLIESLEIKRKEN